MIVNLESRKGQGEKVAVVGGGGVVLIVAKSCNSFLSLQCYLEENMP